MSEHVSDRVVELFEFVIINSNSSTVIEPIIKLVTQNKFVTKMISEKSKSHEVTLNAFSTLFSDIILWSEKEIKDLLARGLRPATSI